MEAHLICVEAHPGDVEVPPGATETHPVFGGHLLHLPVCL
jgi:hypothetical protein